MLAIVAIAISMQTSLAFASDWDELPNDRKTYLCNYLTERNDRLFFPRTY
jgi:hypothetical protein